MIGTLYFINGRFGFFRRYTEIRRLMDELKELTHDYGLESVEVKVVTDKEYGRDEA